MKRSFILLFMLSINFTITSNQELQCWQTSFLMTCSMMGSIWAYKEYYSGTRFTDISPALSISALCCCGSMISGWNELPYNVKKTIRKKLKLE